MQRGMKRCCWSTVLLLCALSPPLVAQRPLNSEVSVGGVMPSGSLGWRYIAEPLLRACMLIVDTARVWRRRHDGEVLRLWSRPALNAFSAANGTYRSIRAMATLMVGPAKHPLARYVVVGFGCSR
jgi:hypothetical protein